MIAAAMPEHLPGALHSLEPTLNHYGYLAVIGLVLIEDFGVPVPGETVLILASVYAGTGRLNIAFVALLAFVGAVVGDNIGYAIGHFGGRPLIQRYGRYIFLTAERIDRATAFFDRHGGWIIVIARFIEGLRQANGIVGYLSGSHINAIYDAATRYLTYVVIFLGGLLLAYVARRVVRVRRARARSTT